MLQVFYSIYVLVWDILLMGDNRGCVSINFSISVSVSINIIVGFV